MSRKFMKFEKMNNNFKTFSRVVKFMSYWKMYKSDVFFELSKFP